jgi:hypothetical protein
VSEVLLVYDSKKTNMGTSFSGGERSHDQYVVIVKDVSILVVGGCWL